MTGDGLRALKVNPDLAAVVVTGYAHLTGTGVERLYHRVATGELPAVLRRVNVL